MDGLVLLVILYNCFCLKDYTLWSMTESLIQSKPFPKDFCMSDIIVVYIDSNTWSMSLSLIIVSAFECE